MYIVLANDVCHPETQEFIFLYGDVITMDIVESLHSELCIDEFSGHYCMTAEAADNVQRQLFDDIDKCDPRTVRSYS